MERDTQEHCFSHFGLHQNHLEGLLKHGLLGSLPEFLVQKAWNGGKEFAFLTSSGDADTADSGSTESLFYDGGFKCGYTLEFWGENLKKILCPGFIHGKLN